MDDTCTLVGTVYVTHRRYAPTFSSKSSSRKHEDFEIRKYELKSLFLENRFDRHLSLTILTTSLLPVGFILV